MGVLIYADPPSADSSWDRWIVKRASSKTGSYSAINGATGQVIANLTYYDETGSSSSWYKILYYDTSSSASSDSGFPFRGQDINYTTVLNVQYFLALPTLSDTTTPNFQTVLAMIARAEDEIDQRTGHSWRTRYSKTVSGADYTQDYEYYDVKYEYEEYSGIPIYLLHRKIKTLDTAELDSLQLFDGSSWTEFIGVKTEDRTGDYWVDYDNGVIYLKTYSGYRGAKRLKIRYRYGEASVNKMVEDIATKMVAVQILMGPDMRGVTLSGGETGISHSDRIKIWKDEIDMKISQLTEIRVIPSSF